MSETTQTALDALRLRLTQHDWLFVMADRNAYAAGALNEALLKADAAKIDGGMKLFEEFRYEQRGRFGLPNA